ncbi:lipid-A-disaccharide synthase N-terminal domain-containing protein [bacterium]|nr:lipid-A-disaccharide synthase N-terminal domain-containing protein [bacterium]
MNHSRRTACVVAAWIVLAALPSTAPAANEQPVPSLPGFQTCLERAATAHEQGDAASTGNWLRKAARQVESDPFHRTLIDAGDAYAAGRLATARAGLKQATRRVNPWFWIILGFAAQVLFTGRFVVQWIASERQKRSVVPVSFWYLSIAGSLLLLTYAIWRQDPVFILGQAFGSLIYVRNLSFIHRKPAAAADEEVHP